MGRIAAGGYDVSILAVFVTDCEDRGGHTPSNVSMMLRRAPQRGQGTGAREAHRRQRRARPRGDAISPVGCLAGLLIPVQAAHRNEMMSPTVTE